MLPHNIRNSARKTLMIRLLVADNNATVRFGLQTLLADEADITVIGEVVDGRAAVTKAVTETPDVVLMDLSMPVLSGVAATREITRHATSVKVLVLTSSCQEVVVRDAFAAGAHGYMLKDSTPTMLLEAIRSVCRGESPLAPMVRACLATGPNSGGVTVGQNNASLRSVAEAKSLR